MANVKKKTRLPNKWLVFYNIISPCVLDSTCWWTHLGNTKI